MPSQTYSIPNELLPGYLLAFRGKGFLSKLIMIVSPGVSHAETIAHNPDSDTYEAFSAVEKGTRFEEVERVVAEAKGTVYFMKLRQDVIERMDMDLFIGAVASLMNKPYDFLHFVGVGIDDWHVNLLRFIPKIPEWIIKSLMSVFRNSPTMQKVVCSGVYAWAMQQALGLDINPSEQTPLDLCRWDIFEPEYIVLKGKDKGIKKYNTVKVLAEKEITNE